MKITATATATANEQLGFYHPANPDWINVSFCQFAAPLTENEGAPTASKSVCIRPGKIDRSPTGTGGSARMAVLHAQGKLTSAISTSHDQSSAPSSSVRSSP